MNIAIIGAGFTGLSAAYRLQQKGHTVTIYEKEDSPGGLAIGYSHPKWEWSLEQHYHHWFTNDTSILSLAKEIDYPVIIKRPKTSVYLQSKVWQLDSAKHLLTFPLLSLFERLRMAGVFFLLFRLNPYWKWLENIQTTTALPKLIGKKAYTLLWEPQLKNKMKQFVDQISLVWFWARIKKRTTSLAYPEKGFLHFAKTFADLIEKNGGKFIYTAEIESIRQEKKEVHITQKTGLVEKYDKVLVTLPTHLFTKLTPQLPQKYLDSLVRLQGLGATNLVLRLRNQFFSDNTYWLSLCVPSSPLLVIVEHTNFMDKTHYNEEHLVYLGNYLSPTDKKFSYSKEQLLAHYHPFLEKLHPGYKKDLIGTDLFHAPFAQPIVPKNYSALVPPLTTPLSQVFLANMQQVYPWDRGTNYAVELGEKAASQIG